MRILNYLFGFETEQEKEDRLINQKKEKFFNRHTQLLKNNLPDIIESFGTQKQITYCLNDFNYDLYLDEFYPDFSTVYQKRLRWAYNYGFGIIEQNIISEDYPKDLREYKIRELFNFYKVEKELNQEEKFEGVLLSLDQHFSMNNLKYGDLILIINESTYTPAIKKIIDKFKNIMLARIADDEIDLNGVPIAYNRVCNKFIYPSSN